MSFFGFFRREPVKPAPVRPAPARRPSASTTAMPSRPDMVVPLTTLMAPVEPPPAELTEFQWIYEKDLAPERRQALLASVRGIPRPPQSMQKLLSPDFVARASSAELSELVMGEPLIAAKVLSTVNSPVYGLKKAISNIGQSVTFLGMNTVRSLCMQYMLADAFKPKLAEAQRSFDAIWKASAIASELCVRLGKALNLPDQGSLSTKVVLSFVGQLAAASLLPASNLEKWLKLDRLSRASLEQEALGLNATEIGCLLMKSWELPDSLVDDVGSVGRQLVTPYITSDPECAPRVALAYLCARLGERFATGDMDSLEGYDPKLDIAADTYHLRAALAHPALAKLEQALDAPDLLAAMDQMLGKVPVH